MVSLAFRNRSTHPRHDSTRLRADDVMRVLDGSPSVVLMANAFGDPFGTCWPEGSRLVLDMFVEAWRSTTRLDDSFAFVRADFEKRAKAIERLGPDDDLGGGPAASLLVAVLEQERIDIRWIGEQQALLVRADTIIARTEPHTLGELARAQGIDSRPHHRVLTRLIRAEDVLEPARASFVGVKGDRLVVVSEACDELLPFENANTILARMPENAFEAVCVMEI